MILNITNLSTSFTEQLTRVTVEVYELIGNIEKLDNKFVIVIPGKHDIVTDELQSLIYDELAKNGFNYNFTVN